MAAQSAVYAQPFIVGEWGPKLDLKPVSAVYTVGVQGIHAILQPNGLILACGPITNNSPSVCDVVLVNPLTGQVQCVADSLGEFSNQQGTPLVTYGHDWFCSGMVGLADGQTLFVGGGGELYGMTSVYVPDMNGGPGTVIKGEREFWGTAPIGVPRWYPTAVKLASHRQVMVIEGNGFDYEPSHPPCCTKGDHKETETPMIWDIPDPATPATWTDTGLGPALYRYPDWPTANPNHNFELPTYPLMFLDSRGRVFYAGGNETPCDNPVNLASYRQSRLLDVSLRSWSEFPAGLPSAIAGASAVMFAPDRIMKAGGWTTFDNNGCSTSPITTTTNKAEVINLAADSGWIEVEPMTQAREWVYLVPLPTGKIMAMGGGLKNGPQLWYPELYDPNANTWTLMAPLNEERSHHHASILCQDGSIYCGGADNNSDPGHHNKTYRIYKPPYFFQGARPNITNASTPMTAYYGQSFTIESPEAAQITKVRLIRLGAATHSFDQNTRMMELSFTSGTGVLTIAAPAHGYLAPPGYYMLFICSGEDGALPCNLARMVQLRNAP